MLQCKENEYFSLARTKNLELACRPTKDGKLDLFFTNGYACDWIIVYNHNGTWAHDGIFYKIPKSLVKALEKFIEINKNLLK